MLLIQSKIYQRKCEQKERGLAETSKDALFWELESNEMGGPESEVLRQYRKQWSEIERLGRCGVLLAV